MTLTFDLYLTLTWVWPLTLTIWRNIFFSFFPFSLKSRDATNVTSYVKRMVRIAEAPFYKEHFAANQKSVPLPVQNLWPIMWFSLNLLKSRDVKTWRHRSKTEHLSHKRNFIRNVLQPTINLCHFRFKSYGPLCDFYKSGDLDLDLYPIFTQKIYQGPWNWVHQLSKFQKNWANGVACTSCNYGQTDKQTDRQTNRGDQYTLQKSTILQSNERALRECILCKIGLTDWVVYLVDWQWQRSRTQSIGPNDSNERCAMSRVLFGINIAEMQKIRDLDLLHLTLTFSLDLWPWYLTLRFIYYYLDALKKTLQKFIVLTSRDAKTAPHSLARRPTYWLVFCQ